MSEVFPRLQVYRFLAVDLRGRIKASKYTKDLKVATEALIAAQKSPNFSSLSITNCLIADDGKVEPEKLKSIFVVHDKHNMIESEHRLFLTQEKAEQYMSWTHWTNLMWTEINLETE